ncbi:BppU family phage baseplate upper protein [Staphylococcus epidermidis]|uniref:BppU family phage baseplate upper protein n=1 Tax=Staphylococcus epidermidis TaxID=1282 RepID=UPI0011A64DD0|nr:BppU family phage baseplate upper protein [Staphylococcus epidermidis]MBC3075829.1 BppU family phage baseplate upper protein [Staphylococcus epidermidis]MBM6047645.1 BppU family phage baseplate upper protein [Staphylococcus epidermidis]MCG1155601.1 BppU family phage baseplate upper protein [Staphylococcus epidermidis]MCO6226772.1 BppU family phage baseplate upper protein [Staphylococcus epidermidis]MCO6232495.1 BppU family phage baseplate upper protein [Staphylococcus epidermidis]
MELKKIGKIEVKNEPYLKPISDEGIGFYNLDDKTAVLRFYVTKNNEPLLISEENTETYIYLESSNGSNQVVENVRFIDPLNGVIEVTIPIEFLQASTNTTVIGQIYISINHLNQVDSDKSSTAVLNEFEFEVGNAIINKINGATKIKYIRMFDELKRQINARATEIQEQLDNLEDYVVKVKNASDEGITKIQIETKKGLDILNQQHSKSLKDVEESLNAAKNTIQNLYEEYDNDIEVKGGQYLKDLRIEVRNIENILSQEGYVTIDEHRKIITEIQEKLPESSDWIEYDLINGAIKNRHYKAEGQNGFNCAYKTIQHQDYKEVILRINADNFKSGTAIAKLPSELITSTQTAFLRTVPVKACGAQLTIEPNGDVKVYISQSDQWSVSREAYIYGEIRMIDKRGE